MNHYLLSFDLSGQQQTLPWMQELSTHGISVYHAKRLTEAAASCKAYPLLMVLIWIDPADKKNTIETIGSLAEALPAQSHIPLVGVHEKELHADQRSELAATGLSGLLAADDPGRFIIWQLEMLAALAELHRFEQAMIDVKELAKHTRDHLHDLSQPLSAIQGRLQLLAARAGDDEPNHATYLELVEQITKATQVIARIQELHRAHS